VTRALEAAQAVGMKIARVEIDKGGKIILIAEHDGAMAIAGILEPNEWDTVK
jgi:hypothetical protein